MNIKIVYPLLDIGRSELNLLSEGVSWILVSVIEAVCDAVWYVVHGLPYL